jgi:hypothetical protein
MVSLRPERSNGAKRRNDKVVEACWYCPAAGAPDAHRPRRGQPDGSPSGYHRIAILRYANAADLQESVPSEIGQQAFADVANFATGGVTVFLTSLESAPATSAVATPVG